MSLRAQADAMFHRTEIRALSTETLSGRPSLSS